MDRRALALDLGSSSVRAIVFETASSSHLVAVDGAMGRRARHLSSSQPGGATFEADSYLADLVACIDELNAKGCLEGVTDVAMDCQWHSIVPIDGSGRPLGAVLSWADTRPRSPRSQVGAREPEAQELERLRQRTGCAFAPMYWTWRAPWLAAERGLGAGAGTGAASSRFLGLSEYVGLVLLGDPTMSVSMASGTGLFATAALGWDEEALNIAGVTAAALPPVAPPDWQGRLAPDWSRRWPALAGARWHASLGDGAAANLGVGCSSPARAAVTVGTSAAVRTVRAAPDPSVLQGGLWRYCVDHERVVLGAAYSSGGQLYTWALSLWEGSQEGSQGPDRPHAGRADDGPADDVRYGTSMPVAAGSEGVLVLPWHVGTRPPAAAVPARQGIVVGLGLEHNGAHIVSASAEAVCFQLAGGLADLEADREAGFARPLEVVANGGAIERSPWWQQRLAAALGRTLLCSAVPETTARGAAAHALGVDLSADQVDGVVVEPHPEEVTALAEARHRWLEWYDKLLPIVS